MAPLQYGDVDNVIARAGVDAESLGLGTEDNLRDFIRTTLTRATQEISQFVGRELTHETGKTVTLDGNNRNSMKLPDWPVQQATEVTVGGTTQSSGDYRVSDAGILERRVGVWPNGWENIEVTYDVGFPDGAGAAEEVAEEIAIETVNKAVAARKADGKSSVSMDGYSVAFDSTLDGINLDEAQRERLRPYREAAVA